MKRYGLERKGERKNEGKKEVNIKAEGNIMNKKERKKKLERKSNHLLTAKSDKKEKQLRTKRKPKFM